MKILISNLMQIGDLVLTTPIFRAFKARYPKVFLAAAVNAHFAELVQFNPFINHLFLINKSSLRSFLYQLSLIRSFSFNFAFNLNSSERSSSLVALSNANFTAGYANFPFSLFFNDVHPNFKRSIHQVRSHFALLNHYFDLDICQTDVFVPPNVQLSIQSFFQQHFKPQHFKPYHKVVAFNVGASWHSKQWLPTYFASLATALADQGFHIAFLGSNADYPLVNKVLSFLPKSNRIHVFTGKFSLIQLAAFFDYCHLLITNDSGPMHIAVARNLPTLSVFGSSPTIGFSPFSANSILIKSPAPCHPCYKHSCPLTGDDYMSCMKLVTPDIVLKYALEMLATFNKPAKDIPRVDDYDCKIIELNK